MMCGASFIIIIWLFGYLSRPGHTVAFFHLCRWEGGSISHVIIIWRVGSFAAAIAQKDRKSIYASLTTTTTTSTRLLPLFTITLWRVCRLWRAHVTDTVESFFLLFFFLYLFLSFVTQWSPGIVTDRLADLFVSVPEGGKKQVGGKE